MKTIKITRLNGKSNSEIIVDYVSAAAPDTQFSYDDLRSALEKDTTQKYTNPMICGVVRIANTKLLRLHQRELRNVRGVGWRVVPAREHMALATIRQGKADKQIRRGLLTLKNVRWSELDDNTRRAHEGQLILTSAIFAQTQALRQRQVQHEAIIADQLKEFNERLKQAENRG